MKLLAIFFALLAFSLAETIEKNEETIEDLQAEAASVDLQRIRKETLQPAASTYNYIPPSQRPPKEWSQNIPNVPVNNYIPPQNNYVPPQNNYVPPQNNYVPPQNNYVPPQNDYVPPTNNYVPPQNNYVPPNNNYVPPQNDYVPPNNNYVPPQNDYVPPTNNYIPPQNWVSTTPAAVIKNEHIVGDNGSYKYEYKLSDGTHVGEEGYILYPNTEYENLVKKGWYSYRGADGKTYTVTYWADNSGYHAFGDHLPQPPEVPPAIQTALDQAAKDEEQKAEAEKYKPIYTTVTPLPTFPHPTYPQPTYPQPTYPQQTYPQQTYPQQTYPQHHHNNYPSSYGK